MLKCLFIRRKLYDYADSSLSEADRIHVRQHLDICDACSREYASLIVLLREAGKKTAPTPSEGFWHDFNAELDRKLNDRLVAPLTFKARANHQLKPALSFITVLTLILAMGAYVRATSMKSKVISQSESELVNELILLDEIDPQASPAQSEDPISDELSLIHQLE